MVYRQAFVQNSSQKSITTISVLVRSESMDKIRGRSGLQSKSTVEHLDYGQASCDA
jgi:hypothetical protein